MLRLGIFLTVSLLLPAAGFGQTTSDPNGPGQSEYHAQIELDDISKYMLLEAGYPAGVSAHSLLLGKGQQPQHPILKGMGLRLRQISDWVVYEHFPLEDQTGMVVENVLGNLPAYNAGIRWHDFVAKVDGKPISSVDEFVKAYEGCKDDDVEIEIIQKGKAKTVTISKADVAKWEKDFKIGVHVHPIPEELALHLGFGPKEKPGLYISEIVKDSPAEKAGLKAGDLLLKADGKTLKTTDVLNNLVRESQGKEMTLEYLRAGKTRELKLAAAEQPEGDIRLSVVADLNAFWAPHYNISGLGPIPLQQPNAAALDRLTKAVEKLTKDVEALRKELKEK